MLRSSFRKDSRRKCHRFPSLQSHPRIWAFWACSGSTETWGLLCPGCPGPATICWARRPSLLPVDSSLLTRPSLRHNLHFTGRNTGVDRGGNLLLSGRDFRDASTRPPSVLELSTTKKQQGYQHGQSLRNRIPVSHAWCNIQQSELGGRLDQPEGP